MRSSPLMTFDSEEESNLCGVSEGRPVTPFGSVERTEVQDHHVEEDRRGVETEDVIGGSEWGLRTVGFDGNSFVRPPTRGTPKTSHCLETDWVGRREEREV